MSFLFLLLTSIALSLDAFAVSVSCGITRSTEKFREKLQLAAFFGIFQGLMPLAAYFISASIKVEIGLFTGPVAFLILAGIGTHMILESKKTEEQCGYGKLTFKKLLILSIATSLDAFATGISLALLEISIWLPVFLISSITFIMSLAGAYFGSRIGSKIKNGAEFVGGIMLILIGLKIFMESFIH